MKIPYSPQ